LEIGDLIHLREISERFERGTGQAFEGRITMVHKRVELVRASYDCFAIGFRSCSLTACQHRHALCRSQATHHRVSSRPRQRHVPASLWFK
jgi:hypothetical protein